MNALLRILLLGIAMFVVACGGDDGGGRPSRLVGTAAPVATCSGADSSAVSRAVFVAAQGVDYSGCGTSTASACKTLQQGIANCVSTGCAVFVRHGLYATQATIALKDGVSVYGGCRFDGEPQRGYRTIVDAKPAAGTPAVSADGVNSPTAFDGIVVMGKDETASGTASIAMAVSNSKGLALTRSVLVAGQGGDGGPVSPAIAAAGQNGGAGNADSFTPGGQGPGGPSCDAGGAGTGGAGSAWQQNVLSYCGGFACDCNPSGGRAGSTGASSGTVVGGGGGGPGTQGNACWEGVIRQGLGGPGGDGGHGSWGACSVQSGVASADIWGHFSAAAWQPGVGGTGGIGSVGSGGGGGGPGGMCALGSGAFSWVPSWGLPGGGGGAGGCAGAGGEGGQQGGASVVLLLTASTLPLQADSMAIVGGQGGQGGHGGPGGVGGPGGAGGPGASSSDNCYAYDVHDNIGWGGPGGLGGPGGQGGGGSGGSGGNGGPSIGIALVGGSVAPDASGVYPGFAALGADGGTGGRGGAEDCSGATGMHGILGGVAAVFDASHPPQNVITPGQLLRTNESRASPNGRYLLTMQEDNNLVLHAVANGVRPVVWYTATDLSRWPPGGANMLTIGSYVVYDACGFPLFSTHTDGHAGASLYVQDDGHVQLIDVDGRLLWYAPCKSPRDACKPS